MKQETYTEDNTEDTTLRHTSYPVENGPADSYYCAKRNYYYENGGNSMTGDPYYHHRQPHIYGYPYGEIANDSSHFAPQTQDNSSR